MGAHLCNSFGHYIRVAFEFSTVTTNMVGFLTTLKVVRHEQTDSVGGLTTWQHLNKMRDAKYTHTLSSVRSLTVQECWELRCSAARLSFFCLLLLYKCNKEGQTEPAPTNAPWRMVNDKEYTFCWVPVPLLTMVVSCFFYYLSTS